MAYTSTTEAPPAGMLPPEGRGRGLRQGRSIRDGFSVVRTDVVYDRETRVSFPCPGNFLRFHFKLSGDSAISGGREFEPVEAGRISFVAQPPESYKCERVRINTHERAVTLICDRDFTASIISPRTELPTFIRDFLQASLSRLTFESMPMPVKLRPIVEDILNPPFSGGMGETLVEAKALELLCLTVHQILNVPSPGQSVRQRDRQRVRDLCALIESEPAKMLSIAQLSRSVAWNETQMMECFKAVTGMTISTYRQQVRMNRARRQLEETDLPVTEIALDAGYEHPSNFATAFKRTFGYPPRAARKHS